MFFLKMSPKKTLKNVKFRMMDLINIVKLFVLVHLIRRTFYIDLERFKVIGTLWSLENVLKIVELLYLNICKTEKISATLLYIVIY